MITIIKIWLAIITLFFATKYTVMWMDSYFGIHVAGVIQTFVILLVIFIAWVKVNDTLTKDWF